MLIAWDVIVALKTVMEYVLSGQVVVITYIRPPIIDCYMVGSQATWLGFLL